MFVGGVMENEEWGEEGTVDWKAQYGAQYGGRYSRTNTRTNCSHVVFEQHHFPLPHHLFTIIIDASSNSNECLEKGMGMIEIEIEKEIKNED
uniref:Uncharacterized protein n=1 Tax=Vespula pensylvanica TaxID=30213 RepID=A0A834U588_VESPE|nr:hypothetical protein H0235_011652 [Vespula pensylvanica]